MFKIFGILLAFICGAMVKAVDWIMDGKLAKDNRWRLIAIGLAGIYGSAIGYIISTSSFALIFLGGLFGQIISGKIDNIAHRTGLVCTILTIMFFILFFIFSGSLPTFQISISDMPLLIFFTMVAWIDEQKLKGKLAVVANYRLALKFATLVPLILWGRIDYLVAILIFDGGYLLVEKLAESIS